MVKIFENKTTWSKFSLEMFSVIVFWIPTVFEEILKLKIDRKSRVNKIKSLRHNVLGENKCKKKYEINII